jgi:hypothetical protein
MMKEFEKQLTGGHPNSLGNTVSVVEQVLREPESFDELFNCYFSQDEVVRLRVSSAMKRLCKSKKSLLIPYIDRFLNEIARIDQASTQWTLAILFDLLKNDLSEVQEKKALSVMKNNLENHNDWIVLNTTMDVLSRWSVQSEGLKIWLIPRIEKLQKDPRKSISNRANKIKQQLNT